MNSWRSGVASRFPATAWRDAKLRAQSAEIKSLNEQLQEAKQELAELIEDHNKLGVLFDETADLAGRTGAPSFRVMMSYYRTYIHHARAEALYTAEPALQLPRKLRNSALAASHGIKAPEVYKTWQSVDEIDLENLPDRFVLKADGGAGGHAVFPLVRTSGGFRRVDDSSKLSAVELRELFAKLQLKGRPPFFAEELLQGEDPNSVADDVKVYIFYGVPAYVLLMRPLSTASRTGAGNRFLDIHGEDIGHVLGEVAYDHTIPVPRHFPEIIEAARHLSMATGTSFCRVDFYDTVDGPRLGEITRAPGTSHHYVYDHDSGMGNEWIRAHARLLQDLSNGRPRGTLWGSYPYTWHYGEAQGKGSPSAWPRTHVDCREWCFSSDA